MDDLDRSVRVY